MPKHQERMPLAAIDKVIQDRQRVPSRPYIPTPVQSGGCQTASLTYRKHLPPPRPRQAQKQPYG